MTEVILKKLKSFHLFSDFAIGNEKDKYPLYIKEFLGGKAGKVFQAFYCSTMQKAQCF